MELREEIGQKQGDGVMNAPPLWVSACQLGAQHSYQFPFKLHPSFPSRQLWGKWIVEWAYDVGNEWPPKYWQGTNRIFMTLPNQARNWNFRFSKDCWFPACLEDFFRANVFRRVPAPHDALNLQTSEPVNWLNVVGQKRKFPLLFLKLKPRPS